MLTNLFYEWSPILLQNILCSMKGLKLRRERYTKRFWHRLEFLSKSRMFDKNAISSYQLDRFNHLLKHAIKTVPYYRQLFAAGDIPSTVHDLAELHAFPSIDKMTLRTRTKDFVTEDRRRHHVILQTSGSTGTPINVVLCKDGLIDVFAMLWRQRKEFGINYGDATATFNGRGIVPQRQSRPPFWRHNIFQNQTLFSQYHTSDKNLKYYCEELDRIPFKLWFGYPFFIDLIARYLEKQNIRLQKAPQLIQTGSETLFPNVRERIESVLKTSIRDNYGCTEGCVSMSECKAGRLHVDQEMCIVELEVLHNDAYTETGALVVTGLSNYGMPLIRYKIGDVGTLCKYPCSCGRSGPTFERIDGRIEDCIVTPRGFRIGRMDHLFKGAKHIEECQLIQEDINSVTLNLVRTPEFTNADEQYLRDRLHNLLGSEIAPVFNYVDLIPRLSNGKFRAVVSKLNHL